MRRTLTATLQTDPITVRAVSSYSSGDAVSGTLGITELDPPGGAR